MPFIITMLKSHNVILNDHRMQKLLRDETYLLPQNIALRLIEKQAATLN